MTLKMDLGDALIDAVMGWAIVFLGIALLVLVVALVGKIMSGKKPAVPAPTPAPAAAPPAPPAPPAPGAAGRKGGT